MSQLFSQGFLHRGFPQALSHGDQLRSPSSETPQEISHIWDHTMGLTTSRMGLIMVNQDLHFLLKMVRWSRSAWILELGPRGVAARSCDSSSMCRFPEAASRTSQRRLTSSHVRLFHVRMLQSGSLIWFLSRVSEVPTPRYRKVMLPLFP